jgi:hypothetical protein
MESEPAGGLRLPPVWLETFECQGRDTMLKNVRQRHARLRIHLFNAKRVARRDAPARGVGLLSLRRGEIPITSGDPNHYKFTGKERDTELQVYRLCYTTGPLNLLLTCFTDVPCRTILAIVA